jgi:hypothetical protein
LNCFRSRSSPDLVEQALHGLVAKSALHLQHLGLVQAPVGGMDRLSGETVRTDEFVWQRHKLWRDRFWSGRLRLLVL